MLTLPIKRKWFDMILSGEKTEEYREICKYYDSRFRNVWGSPAWWGEKHKVRFRNGYRTDSASFIAECTLSHGYGKQEWGAEIGKNYFVLKIKSIEMEASR